MDKDEFETWFDDLHPTRPLPDAVPRSLLEQLRFAAELVQASDPPAGPVILHRDDHGDPVATPVRDGFCVGRSPEADLTIAAPELSSRHMVFRFPHPEDPAVVDLDSANGTFVNRRAITEPQPLNSGDIIEAGGRLLVFIQTDTI